MGDFTKFELEEALRAITSTIHKCEKAQEKMIQKQCVPQQTLLRNRLKALSIASSLINKELASADDTTPQEAERNPK